MHRYQRVLVGMVVALLAVALASGAGCGQSGDICGEACVNVAGGTGGIGGVGGAIGGAGGSGGDPGGEGGDITDFEPCVEVTDEA
ncbi:MAG: hypothetical protein JRI68_34200, partial [Deltaproteobacteria bacterium]|nr:hypothetical protein [Deltaproteobacteria bacterium]